MTSTTDRALEPESPLAARALVEGQTERLALPYALAACGHDGEVISIVEFGCKPTIVLLGRVCPAVGVPFVALHDRDRHGEALSEVIRGLAGDARTVVLAPDFEHVAKLRGRHHKPERTGRRFAETSRDEVPKPCARRSSSSSRLRVAGR